MGNLLFKYAYPVYFQLYRNYKSISDSAERKLINQYLEPGAIVADLGANIGIYTAFFSEIVGPGGEVHAFEPSPENFFRLRQNTQHLKNVRINQTAVGDTTGKLKLYISDELNVDHRTYPPLDSREVLEVDCTRLDDYFLEDKKVDFIKMDIQGFEYHALLGMQEIIAKNNDLIILCEFWPYGLKAAGSAPNNLIELFNENGFNLYTPSRRGLIDFANDPAITAAESYINIFASRRTLITNY